MIHLIKRLRHHMTGPIVLWIVATGLAGAGDLKSDVVMLGITGGAKALRLAVNVVNGDIRTEARCDDLRNQSCTEAVYGSKRYPIVPDADLGAFTGRISLPANETVALEASGKRLLACGGPSGNTIAIYTLGENIAKSTYRAKHQVYSGAWVGDAGGFVLLSGDTSAILGFRSWWKWFGHPPQKTSWFLEVYSADAILLKEIPVAAGEEYSAGAIIP